MDAARILAGRYTVGELIGRGGMAEVHIGHDTRLGRAVAIKILRSDLARDPSFQARFRREAQAAAALNHPAIVAVYDTGEDVITDAVGNVAHVPFIVMEYVEGHTVRDILRDGGTALPIEEALEIIKGVLSALEYSHHAGIVHRDIKPANVMLTPAGAIKVMDFGIARAMADSAAGMTQTQAVIGTAQYLSPEQARGESVDARSDLYSTGCLLFELLTGRAPFVGDSPVAVAYQHVREIAPRASSLSSDVPEGLDRITAKALAKEREARYQSATEFRADIENFERGSRIIAGPVGAAAAAIPAVEATQVLTAPPAFAGTVTTTQPAAAPLPWAAAQSPFPTPQQPGYDDDDDEPGGLSRRTLIILISLGVLVLAAVLFFIFKPSGSSDPATIKVPDVVGMTEEAAKDKLRSLDLVPTRMSEPSIDVPEGSVTRTDPTEGTEVASGSKVEVWVSAGPDSIAVPDLTGKTQQEARQALIDAGLQPGDVIAEDEATQEKDRVTRTEPQALQAVKSGDSITIYIASGDVNLPDLTGKTEADATKILSDLTLIPKFETEESDAPVDTVIKQSLTAGKVAQKSPITVTLATAKTTAAVPAINGQGYDAYAAAVTAAGMTPKRGDDTFSETVPAGTVMSTNPAPGTTVQKGSVVTITVSKGKDPAASQVAVPQYGTQTYDQYATTLANLGLKATKSEVVDPAKPAGTITGTNPGVGTKVDPGSTVTVTVTKIA